MKLSGYLDSKKTLGSQYEKFIEFKNKMMAEGIPENIAEYRASVVLTPTKLERLCITANKSGGNARTGIVFFLSNDEEVALIARNFKMIDNGKELQVSNSALLIEFLKTMESINVKEK